MKRAFFPLALAALALGCSSEPEKKPEGKKPFLELRIQSTKLRTISVTSDGGIADVLSGSPALAGKLKPDEWKSLKELATSIDWSKLPLEGFKTPDGNRVAGGRSYDLTYSGTTPPRAVHSMDGAAEVASFTRLRDRLELDANGIGR